MRIGLVCAEYFDSRIKNGKVVPTSAHGGFGFLTKLKAEWLAENGHDVHVFTYTSSYDYEERSSKEFIQNGVNVHLIQQNEIVKSNIIYTGINAMFHKPKADEQFKEIVKRSGIQILQFEDTPTSMMLSYLPALPNLLIFQDPFDFYDTNLLIDSERNYFNNLNGKLLEYRMREHGESFPNEIFVNFLQRKNFIKPMKRLITKSKSLKIFTEADFIGQKVQKMFNLAFVPETIRNPIAIASQSKVKSSKPSFVWVGRWDPQKRPDTMLMCASELPEYDFYMIGTATRGARDYVSVEKKLIEKFSKYSNIHILGFIDEVTKRDFIGRSWALVNTSVREGLPITFLEALAEGTPIVSYVDPDSYATKFGVKVDYTIESFKKGIEKIVGEKLFEKIGAKEREFARKEHDIGIIMNRHLDIYNNMLRGD